MRVDHSFGVLIQVRFGEANDNRYGSASSLSFLCTSWVDHDLFWDWVVMLGECGGDEEAVGVEVEFVVCISMGD